MLLFASIVDLLRRNQILDLQKKYLKKYGTGEGGKGRTEFEFRSLQSQTINVITINNK